MLILNIDTATEYASVCLSKDKQLLAIAESKEQKSHASFLQPAIEKITADNGISLQQIDAVAVTIGPGSYTGLRVGLASAKGICFALGKPLITLGTLEVMAQAAIDDYKKTNADITDTLFCPMIDARRMEVFTAVYSSRPEEIWSPKALVLEENSFESLSNNGNIIFSGSGSDKLQKILTQQNAQFSAVVYSAANMISLAFDAFNTQNFADLAYCAPLYVKEFFDPKKAHG